MKELKTKAIAVVACIERRNEEYYEVNRVISELQENLPTYLHVMDSEVDESIMPLLDLILDGMATYYLYDMRKGAGHVTEACGREWHIRNIDELTAYCLRDEE